MQYLGNTEISSPTPVIHIGCKYWVRSRTTGKVTLIECKPSLYSTKYGYLNIESRLRFERFDIFGPVVDEATQPDFDALITNKGTA
jgi:hypothetical protein